MWGLIRYFVAVLQSPSSEPLIRKYLDMHGGGGMFWKRKLTVFCPDMFFVHACVFAAQNMFRTGKTVLKCNIREYM